MDKSGTQQITGNQMAILNVIWENNRGANFRFAVIIVMILCGLLSNFARTYVDMTGDKRQKRIEYLDQRVIELEAKLESCNSGTPMPTIKDMK